MPPFEADEDMTSSMATAITSLPVLPKDERASCGLLQPSVSIGVTDQIKCTEYNDRPKECVRWVPGSEECRMVLHEVKWDG